MTTKDSIKKLNAALRHGDMKAIAVLAEFTTVTVSKFFNGEDDLISDEAQSIIIEATRKVIKARKDLKKSNQRNIDKIIKEA